ncbi:NUDIX hydrolase [Longispora albida]|uniref:NUDIX hydrolase n=1 Tax=Longispora albida TaxID=203523 RepID=UPI00038159BD|nr:NUDIX hydrolase [Longispora albida]
MSLYEDALDAYRALEAKETLELLEAGPVALTREHVPGHVTASALILSHDLSQVLLCLHGKFKTWCQLGGHCEPGDRTLAGAALREATEESGIEGLRLLPGPIHWDIHPVSCQGGSYHHDIRYAVIAPPGAVAVCSDESDQLAWFPVDALPTPLTSSTECLVEPAIRKARDLEG